MTKSNHLFAIHKYRLPRQTLIAITTTILSANFLPSAWAQTNEEKFRDGGSQWGVGIGVAMEQRPYRDFDDKAQLIPMITYENKWVSLSGPSFDVKLPSAGPFAFRLRARYSNDGYEADDSSYLTGMDKRKNSFWVGGAAIWYNNFANLTTEVLTDGSDNSKGKKFKLQVDRRLSSGAFGFTPRVAVHMVDSKYVAYYYGVRASDARIDRPRYDGESTTNIEVGLRLDYAVTPKQLLFVDIGATSFGSGIKESPLVDHSSQSGVRAGYVYRF
jgi:outer membrane scaffolding protein for murein synthesis (MipA/OmpV family)